MNKLHPRHNLVNKNPKPNYTQSTPFARFPEVRGLFLKHLARYGNMTAAAQHVRCSRSSIRTWIARHPDFQGELDAALDEHRAKIEKAIHDRAILGWNEPKFSTLGQIGVVRRYSDQLLLAYAKRHIKEYRDGEAPLVHSGTVKHEHVHAHRVDVRALTKEQRGALRLLLGPPPEEQETKLLSVEVGSAPDVDDHNNGEAANGYLPEANGHNGDLNGSAGGEDSE